MSPESRVQWAAVLVCGWIFLGLDLSWRAYTLLPLSPLHLASNAALMALFTFGCLLLLGLACAFTSRALGGNLVVPVFYLLTLYVNLVYARLFAILTFHADPAVAGRWVAAAGVLLVAGYRLGLGRAYRNWLKEVAGAVTFASAAVAALLAVSGLVGYVGTPSRFGSEERVQSPPRRFPHILLLTADSLSARHMSLYGYARPTTPNLVRYGARSYVFERMVTGCNSTTYALPGVLGRYPHQPEPDLAVALAPEYPRRILATFSRLHGNLGRGFSSTFTLVRADEWLPVRWLGPGPRRLCTRWLAGFLSEDARYYNLLAAGHPRDFNQAPVDPYPTQAYLRLAREVLLQSDAPTLLWVHLFATHFPFFSSPPFQGSFGSDLRGVYDAAVADLDGQVGRFLDFLQENGLEGRVLVVLSSDHGESVSGRTEAGWTRTLHGAHWTNPDVEAVPLVLHLPGQTEGARPKTFATHVDLAPTLLEVLGLQRGQWPGESLVPYFKDTQRLSEALRLAVPESYFVRKRQDLDPLPARWASNRLEQFLAYRGRYRVSWLQGYSPDPQRPRRLDRVTRAVVVGLYDAVADPGYLTNRVKDPEMAGTLRSVMEAPLCKVYLDGTADEARDTSSRNSRR
ncbi:MAG: sulfatase-like hydrolase/transferase [Candidatus Eremiobacterota bacterium]